MEEEFERIEEAISRSFGEAMKRKPDGGGPFVYGFSMRTTPEGKPVIREFGNVKPSSEAETCGLNQSCLDVKKEREPLVDIVNANMEIKVIVELPGVEKEDIKLSGTEIELTISVETPGRKYYKEIKIPEKVDPKKARTAYKNGVLEVTLPKIEEKKEFKGEEIKVE